MTLSREAALRRLRRSRESDYPAPRSWTCRVGLLTLRLPNFRWRQRAIAAHDLHHLMAGYPMTLRGEFQMAAWELGAGRYRHWGATLFCGPLLLIGFLWSPTRMRAAYRQGCKTTSLYAALDEKVRRA
jgi:hypothetical protein